MLLLIILQYKRQIMADQPQFSFLPFQPCPSPHYSQLQQSTPLCQSMVRLKCRQTVSSKFKLFHDCITLQTRENHQKQVFWVEMDMSLRFEKILKVNNYGKHKLEGLKLINHYQQEIALHFDSAKQANTCLRLLSQRVTQLGFHKHYKVIRTLGKGSSGSVYQIQRLEDSQRLAMKVFSKEQLKKSDRRLNRFFNELQILKSLSHDSVVTFQGLIETEDSYLLLMEHLQGGTLLNYLYKHKEDLSINQIKMLVKGILQGLAFLQQRQIVHRDIKLQNVVLRDRDSLEPVIVDFGLAVHATDSDYYSYRCGTPGYMYPESFQLQKGYSLSPTADVFSVGAILHLLLMGKSLFPGKTSNELINNNKEMQLDFTGLQYQKIDQNALDLMQKMLAKDPEQRWPAHKCLSHNFFKQSSQQKEEVFSAQPSLQTQTSF